MLRGTAFIVLALMLLTSVAAVLPGDPGFSGCVIAHQGQALRDVDCDRTPDAFDNCPLTNNPDQLDRDRNGIGDYCDLVIDEVVIEPEAPMQGRSMIATVYILNNRAYPMKNVVVKMELPKLGVATNEDIAAIAPGERAKRELLVRIPECAPTRFTDVAIYAEYPFAPGQREVFAEHLKVPVIHGGTCSQDPGADTTVVNILEIQDVHPESGALYPFTIHNMQSESRAYVLSTEGLEDWGYAELHPGAVIVIPAGETRDGAIQVWARPGISGRKGFTFTVQARDDVKQTLLTANVPQTVEPQGPGPQLFFGLLAFLLILLAAGLYVIFRKRR